MFYCDDCRVKNEWPEGLVKSMGPCEICGKTRVCNDVASRLLPLPKQEPAPKRLDFENVPPLTREQAAIVGLYTDVTAGPFGDIHELADTYEPGITTLAFAMDGVAKSLKEQVKPLFLSIAAKES